jgi:hypothetical protein
MASMPQRSSLYRNANRSLTGRRQLMQRSFQNMIVLLLTFAIACGSAGCLKDATGDRDKSTIHSEPTPQHGSNVSSTDPERIIAAASAREMPKSLEQRILNEADLARSSWEDPFRSRLWSHEGWHIDDDSMTCESEVLQPATFLRPYRNLVVECQFSQMAEVDLPADPPPIEFELRLLNRNTHRWASLSQLSGQLTLSESGDEASSEAQPLRESTDDVDKDSQEVNVRLTMTPNRILVAIDGQLRMNLPRPTSTLNAECLCQFIGHTPGITLTNLRFEGD